MRCSSLDEVEYFRERSTDVPDRDSQGSDMVRDATQQEVQALRRENVELKQLVAELSLEGHRLKKTAIPILHAAAGTRG